MLYQQDCDGQARPPINADDFPTFAAGDHAHLHCVLSIDAGNSDGDEASFSVIQAWAFDENNLYLMDQFREQCEFDKLKRMARRFKRRYRPDAILIEKTANGPALISEIRRKGKNRHLIVPITPRGSKAARLNRHIDKIRDGHVQIVEGAACRAEFVAEFEAFPHGEHADQVDAFTQTADWSSNAARSVRCRGVVVLLCPWLLAAIVSFLVLTHGNRLPLSQGSGGCAHGAGIVTVFTHRTGHSSK